MEKPEVIVYYGRICATRMQEGRGDMAKEAKARNMSETTQCGLRCASHQRSGLFKGK
jgi:hypothetical protein